MEGFVALEDATVVRRLRAAGATLVGSTHAAEMGFGLAGDSAAQALENGSVDVVLMTDTLGEGRVAAASAGVFGLKPSYGRVSRFGLVGLVPSMDCCSILGRNLDDVAAAMEAVEGHDDRDPSMGDYPSEAPGAGKGSSPGRERSSLSAGVLVQSLESLDAGGRKAFEEALGRVEKAGIALREVQCEDFNLFRIVHNVIGSVEASSSCGKFDGVRYGHCAAGAKNWNEMYLRSRGESFGRVLKAYLFQGAYFQFENYPAIERACSLRAKLARMSREWLDGVDMMILPTRCAAADDRPAETVEQVYDAFPLTLPANVTGQPALTLPGFLPTPAGDLGLQLVGPVGGDRLLLEAAGRLYPRREEAR